MSIISAETYREAAENEFMAMKLDIALAYAEIAKELSPQLDGIDQLLVAYNTHAVATHMRINGETDWYEVLGVEDASANVETIKRRYKKMALLVHPDKNKSVAADGAFKIISKAWNILSNPVLRKAFDDRSCYTPILAQKAPCNTIPCPYPCCRSW